MANVSKDSGSADGENDAAMAESSKQAPTEKRDDDEKLCPLFMDGLPNDFSTNPGLAAIATLLVEESDESVPKKKEYEAPPTRAGGGKVRRTPARSRRKDGRPYDSRERQGSDTKAVSVGEAHLFLKMWKL